MTMQPKILLTAPLLTLSGYGEQGRLALRSLLSCQDEFDIYVKALNWGACGWIHEDNEERRVIDELLKKTLEYEHASGGEPHYHASIQCTIPNEWANLADINIGYTAGIETTRVSHQWLEKSRMMTRIIVVSEHSKNVFNGTGYEMRDGITNAIKGELKNYTPIDVVHYPVKKFDPVEEVKGIKFSTKFNFLTVAQSGPRKNVHNLITSFIEEFHDDKDTGLVLKLFTRTNSPLDKEATSVMVRKITNHYPNKKCKIHLLHGGMTDAELNTLYTHPSIKGYVTLTHGEGFGLPIFEAAYNGLPVIAPEWSGHVDFLFAPAPSRSKKKNAQKRIAPHFLRVDYTLGPVPPEVHWEGVIVEGSQWCVPDNLSAKTKMRELKNNHKKHKTVANRLKRHVHKTFTEENVYGSFVDSVRLALKGNVTAPQDVKVFG